MVFYIFKIFILLCLLYKLRVFILVHQCIDKEVRERTFHVMRPVGEADEGRRE